MHVLAKQIPDKKADIIADIRSLPSYPSYHSLAMILARHLGLDPNRVTEVNYGEWQGVLVYVLAPEGYQPIRHYVTKVFYGSCSGCDSLEAAAEGPNPEEDLYILILHMAQDLKEI